MKRIALVCLVLIAPAFGNRADAAAQDPAPAAQETPEQARERKTAERFMQLLERTPRFGTALDRVYGYYVERGTLQAFVDSLKQRTQSGDDPGLAWMLLGMFEFQRGNDGEAVAAFREADKLRTEDPLAAYYLGRALVLVGQTDRAAQAFERALQRKPSRIDVMEIFQTLGRIYQRNQDEKKAAGVWSRLEALFPDDAQVREEIAGILADEGDHEGALARYQKLSSEAKDPYRQVENRMKAGEQLLKLGRSQDAIALFEQTLLRLKPESWLHRNVRTKIEQVFVSAGDYDGLTKYYEKWLENHGDDVEAMSRLGAALSAQGRLPEAEQWFARAIELAPGNARLRESLIQQLMDSAKFTDAIEQYKQLAKIDPSNFDYIEKWGQLTFEAGNGDEAQRKADAEAIWRKMLDGRENDPVAVIRVADLLRHIKSTDAAIALYRKAIDLAPDNSQYREYLGEYYFQLKKPELAKATWKEIATGSRRTRPNLVRLAEVYHGFNLLDDAIGAMTSACEMDPEFADRIQFAQLLREAKRYDDTHKQLDQARQIAENDDERDTVLTERIATYLESEQLSTEIQKLQRELDAGTDATVDRWRRLALYFEAASQSDDAAHAIDTALKLDGRNIPALVTAARIYEGVGRLEVASELNQKLAAVDRQFRSEYLERIASLEMRLGRTEEALRFGRELIESAAGNPDHYQFYAGLCFRLGRTDEGLDTLRRGVRQNPTDADAVLTLASALSEQFRTDEAIELYWRAFEKCDTLDDKLSVVSTMADLYLRTSHFDRLVTRLERIGKDGSERDATICIAAAYKAIGDFGTSRITLEKLLTEDTRDAVLLRELESLAEAENEYDLAARFQRRVIEIAPGRENEVKLAKVLLLAGETQEAEALWIRLVEGEDEPRRVYKTIDQMMGGNKFETPLALTERMLQVNPRDWEALFRKAIALWRLDRMQESGEVFAQIAELPIDDDTPSAEYQHREEQRKKRGTSTPGAPVGNRYPPVLTRQNANYYIQQRLAYGNYSYSRPSQWSPDDFGAARIAALWALHELAQSRDDFKQRWAAIESGFQKRADTDPQAMWNLYYINSFKQDGSDQYQRQFQLARKLSHVVQSDTAAYVYLSSLRLRNYVQGNSWNPNVQTGEPLDDEELQHMLECFRRVQTHHPEWMTYAGGPNVVINELNLAKKEELADDIYQKLLAEANDLKSIGAVGTLAAAIGKFDDAMKLAERLRTKRQAQSSAYAAAAYSPTTIYARIIEQPSVEENPAVARRALLAQLDFQREEFISQPAYRRYRSIGSQTSVRVYSGLSTARRSVSLSFPRPGPYFDSSAISLLYRVFDLHKRHDCLADLTADLDKSARQASPSDILFRRLALGYVSWWAEDKDRALTEISAAVDSQPNDELLHLELAGMYRERNEPARALQLVDEVEPTNRHVLQYRELLSLQLAVLVGNLDRAREAAKRLFGLQLDTQTQLQLASQMQQLGMYEFSDALLARSRRRAGNQTGTLLQLMQQYQSRGKPEVAAQIAHQILRRSHTPAAAMYGRSNDDQARDRAIAVLKVTGDLKRMIDRTEALLERSPNSEHLLETLAEYYQAAGREEDAKKLVERITQLKPDDPRALFQLGKRLLAAKDYAGACDMFAKSLKIDPSPLGSEYYVVYNAFQSAKRPSQLTDVFLDADLTKLGNNYYYVQNQIEAEYRRDGDKDKAFRLFEKAWKAMPRYRTYLLNGISDDAAWEDDRLYDYARKTIIPEESANITDPWSGLTRYYSYDGSGKISGSLTRLMAAATKKNRLKSLETDVAAAFEHHPRWLAGDAILAILEAKANHPDECKARIARLMDDHHGSIPQNAGWMIASELADLEPVRAITIQLLESIVRDDSTQQSNNSFQYTPGRLLVSLYSKEGRDDEARNLLFELLDKEDYSGYSSNPGYAEYQELQSRYAAVQALLEMKFPMDAFRLVQETLADETRFDVSMNWGGGSMKPRFENQLAAVKKAITPQVLKKSLDEWIRTGDEIPADVPVVNFMLAVSSRSIDQATVSSFFEQGLELSTPEWAAAAFDSLEKQRPKLLQSRPGDLSYDVAAALLALKHELPGNSRAALIDRLVERCRASAKLPEDASAQQRRIAVWLVARKALRSDEFRQQADELTNDALRVARRAKDRFWLIAILRERGEIALKHGDKKTAETYWTELLEVIFDDNSSLTSADAARTGPLPTAATARPVPRNAAKRTFAEGRTTTLVEITDPVRYSTPDNRT